MGQFGIILADPPWTYKVWSKRGAARTASSHYPVMSTVDICNLGPSVLTLSAVNTILLLWSTWPNLLDSLRVIDSWGFTYKTAAFLWAKRSKLDKAWHTGMGHYTRANTETVLLATRGKPLPRYSKAVKQLLIAPIQEHSRKPDQIYPLITALFGADVPKLELFARRLPPEPNWTAWGHSVTGSQTLAEFSSANDIAVELTNRRP